jgi:hypothetical protein
MAYLNVARWEGDPDALVAVMRDHVQPAAALVAETYGGLMSLHARTPDGIITVSVYESADSSDAMHKDPRFRPAFEKLMETPPTTAWQGELFGVRISDGAHDLSTHAAAAPSPPA